ncbi:MAG: hypothetical protein LBS39_02130 [Campylobacteraceae bacterium]|jgi:conjugal transfer/entry exclusion protein|nr:hypothetical protein [Campylobacteraceae bacterium]
MKSIKYFMFVLGILVVALSNSYGTGIPVADGSNSMQNMQVITNAAQQYTKEAEDWLITIDHYQKQINAYAEQFKNYEHYKKADK